MRRLLTIALVLVFAMLSAFALDGIVTWTWYTNDWDVQFYRYQVDGEEDDKWTVVGWDVSEVTLELDVSVVHTLYLQQSYDGVVWSASSATDSEIYEVPEPVEETTVVEEIDGDIGETHEEIPEEEVTEKPVPEEVVEEVVPQKEREPFFLDFGVGYLNAIPNSAGPKMLGAFASYNHSFHQAGAFEIGAKANLALYTSKNLFFNIRQTRLFTYANVLAQASIKVGNCDIYGAFGPEIAVHMVTDPAFHAGLAIELGVRYHRFNNLFLGFAISDHYYLMPFSNIQNQFDVRVFATRGF